MVFKARKDNNGELDSRINVKGRIVREKPLNRELKDRYLLELLRKLRPGQATAISKMLKIIGDKETQDANAIKASALVLSTYTSLIKELYGKDEESDEEESVEPLQEEHKPQPKFSLVMLPSAVPKEETKE
jgi:hypothetical protein